MDTNYSSLWIPSYTRTYTHLCMRTQASLFNGAWFSSPLSVALLCLFLLKELRNIVLFSWKSQPRIKTFYTFWQNLLSHIFKRMPSKTCFIVLIFLFVLCGLHYSVGTLKITSHSLAILFFSLFFTYAPFSSLQSRLSY